MLTQEDICPGTVVDLETDVLDAWGAASNALTAEITHPQMLLCIYADQAESTWVPLYTQGGGGKQWLSTNGRTGEPHWTHGRFYYRPGDYWRASPSAVMAASFFGSSARGRANRLDPAEFPAQLVRIAVPSSESNPEE